MIGSDTTSDMWTYSMIDQRASPFIVTHYQEGYASFSPDGRWFTSCVNDSGRDQVYVEAYPRNGTRVRLSTDNGSAPVWSADGKHIFYATSENRILEADVSVQGGAIRAGLPHELFTAPVTFAHYSFLVDRTGERFLLPASNAQSYATPLTIVVNWSSSLPRE